MTGLTAITGLSFFSREVLALPQLLRDPLLLEYLSRELVGVELALGNAALPPVAAEGPENFAEPSLENALPLAEGAERFAGVLCG